MRSRRAAHGDDHTVNQTATETRSPYEPNCDLCKSSLCCRHWDVIVSEQDVARLREGLGCSETEFHDRYLGREVRWSAEFRWQLGRTHDAIGEKCVFLFEGPNGQMRCSVYPHRPQLCREFVVSTCNHFVPLESVGALLHE